MSRDLDDLSDAELLTRARDGESRAFGVLWKRHWSAGRAMAAAVTGRFEPDDLASEAFVRILNAVEKGKGPKSGFRSYLATTVRNVAIDWSRRKSTANLEDPDAIEDWSYSEVTALDKIERETIAKAFYALPDSWQEVLWYTQMEDMSPRDVAPILGLTPNAVSALAVRAREGLRQAWIGAHLAEIGPGDPVHEWTIKKLGAHARDRLSTVDRRRVMDHLDDCDACSNAAGEADRVGSQLALGLLPLILGVAGAAAYAEWAAAQNGAVAAASTAALVPFTPTRVRDALTTVGSGSHAGLTAVAASVAVAAVLTAGTIVAAQQGDAPSVRTSDVNAVPAAPGEALAREEGSRPAEEPESSVDEEDDPSPPYRTPTPGNPAQDQAVSVLADDAVPADDDVPTGIPEGPVPSPATPDVPNAAIPAPEPVGPEPVGPELLHGREAAVRTIPADDTVFAYRLGEGRRGSQTDFIHDATAQYESPADGSTWALRDGTLRESTDVFSVQIWFTSAVGGGRLLGYSSSAHGLSSKYDRHLFLADDGRLVFGVFPGSVRTIISRESYTDGTWHQATATLSPAGMALYVDGERVAYDGTVTTGQSFAGYWRVGYDRLDNWGPATPLQHAFAGELAYAAVYRVALTPEQIRAQWILGR
ncbi:sigma-70 family RNA polymerase sigma factor [Leifsonia sp. RAF41]|uniref:sigma-70 family RNA polymerase sigma factor n=1 Tax=Leifsonia sp. RAF41 TaxID=3233056 RepID=UPI003F9BFC44